MGSYLNPGSANFKMALNSQIFIDKSNLIETVNKSVNTLQRFICVSRPRRFGKSMAADMLAAYYDCGEDTSVLFDKLKIGKSESYKIHLNQYDVIKINMQQFLTAAPNMDDMLFLLQKGVLSELRRKYPDYVDTDYLTFAMNDIYSNTRRPFVILIDEWDCLFREYQHDQKS